MPERNVELARRGIEAYGRAGGKAFLDFLESEGALHPAFSFRIHEDLPNGGDWPGTEGFLEMIRSWLEAWDEFEIEPHEFIPSGRTVLVPVKQRAVARDAELEVEGEFFYLLVFEGDAVREVRLYADRAIADAAVVRIGQLPGQ